MSDLIGNGLMFLVIALLVLLLVGVWIRLLRDPISQVRRRIEEESFMRSAQRSMKIW